LKLRAQTASPLPWRSCVHPCGTTATGAGKLSAAIAEPPCHGDKASSDIEQRHGSRIAEQVQSLQRDDGEQDRLPDAGDEEEAKERQRVAAREGSDRGWNDGASDHGAALRATARLARSA
jgi:hypothetical protein